MHEVTAVSFLLVAISGWVNRRQLAVGDPSTTIPRPHRDGSGIRTRRGRLRDAIESAAAAFDDLGPGTRLEDQGRRPVAPGSHANRARSRAWCATKVLYEIASADHFAFGSPLRKAGGALGRYGLAWPKVFLEGDERYRTFLLEEGPDNSAWMSNLSTTEQVHRSARR